MVEGMKVKAGYKKTVVGVIPEDWEYLKAEKCVSIKTGSKNTQDRIQDGKYPFFVRSQQIERINSFSFDCEAVLTAGDGVGTGKVFHHINQKFDVHQRVYVMSDFKNVTGSYFFHYFSEFFYDEVCKYTAKSSVDSVRRDMIAKMLIPIPPLKEQKAIATDLTDTDNLISSLEKLIDKKKKIKQGTMQQLLTGKKRSPGFSGSTIIISLNEVLELNKGEQLNRSSLSTKGEYPVINGGVEPSGYTDKWNTHENTITISEGGNSCGYVNYLKTKFWSGGHAYTVKLKSSQIDQQYLYQLLKFNEPCIMSLRVGSGLPNIQKKMLYEYKINLNANLLGQKAIATILSDMDSEIELLQQKLSKYKTIKQGMMQELLTGRIRLI